ncbi:hypothetical protein [Sulfitobacter pacificus]|uniref:Uncharacterized protein n=1 Tax=Sulfitobacter pacificus TaxID=1499314 RepID=A0ABQ5VGD9_9RHOB|nr:hypothetical protein [Sulfitobacter pacificus]GLQ26155.1 hypothetical protein GCM10007927_09580 [Sulfitobacter pacificus]
MSDAEKALRDQIAEQIAAKFGSLAPYKLVQDFVRKGVDKKEGS